MHAAPPVRIFLAPDRGWRALRASLAGAAIASLVAWLALQAGLSTLEAAGLALILAAVGAASAWWFQPDRSAGTLSWDGAVWPWQVAELQPLVGTVGVMLDLDGWLLVHVESVAAPGRAAWWAVSRRQSTGAWAAWRAALYSRHPADARAARASTA